MPITMEMAEQSINDIVSQKERVLSIEYIQEVISKYFGIDIKDLKSSKKSNDIVFPRQIAMYLCRTMANASFPKIGDEFGRRDHTTVMHAYKKIDKEMKTNPNTKLIVDNVKKNLTS
jgi:chromosomal replication initiator protein